MHWLVTPLMGCAKTPPEPTLKVKRQLQLPHAFCRFYLRRILNTGNQRSISSTAYRQQRQTHTPHTENKLNLINSANAPMSSASIQATSPGIVFINKLTAAIFHTIQINVRNHNRKVCFENVRLRACLDC